MYRFVLALEWMNAAHSETTAFFAIDIISMQIGRACTDVQHIELINRLRPTSLVTMANFRLSIVIQGTDITPVAGECDDSDPGLPYAVFKVCGCQYP